MKRISITLLAVILTITASFNAFAQTEQTRQVSGFNSIASAGSFIIHVKMGGTESLKLSAPKDMINDIETVVENNKLEIRFKQDRDWSNYNRYDGKIEIYITAKSLSALSVAGSGTIKVDGVLNSSDLKFSISGSGNITTTVKSTELNATITGSGSINVDGSTENAHLVVTGSGRYDAKGLKAGAMAVTITGSGNAHVYADKTLAAHITGSGHLAYSGNASVNDIRTAGSSHITKEN